MVIRLLNRDWLFNEYNFWRLLMNLWTLLFFVVIILDFMWNNVFTDVLNILSAIYIGVLAIYVSNKEFERWYSKHKSQHPGELFVVLWSLLVFGIMITNIFIKKPYELPASVVSSYIAVMTILAITRKSKNIYHKRRRKHIAS